MYSFRCTATPWSRGSSVTRRRWRGVVVAHCRAQPQDMLAYGVPMPAFARDTVPEAGRTNWRSRRRTACAASPTALHAELAAEGGRAVARQCRELPSSWRRRDGWRTWSSVVQSKLANLIVIAETQPGPQPRHQLAEVGSVLDGAAGADVPCAGRGGDVSGHAHRRCAGAFQQRRPGPCPDTRIASHDINLKTGGKGGSRGAPAEELVDYYRMRSMRGADQAFRGSQRGRAACSRRRRQARTSWEPTATAISVRRCWQTSTRTIVDTAEICACSSVSKIVTTAEYLLKLLLAQYNFLTACRPRVGGPDDSETFVLGNGLRGNTLTAPHQGVRHGSPRGPSCDFRHHGRAPGGADQDRALLAIGSQEENNLTTSWCRTTRGRRLGAALLLTPTTPDHTILVTLNSFFTTRP